MLGVQHRRVHGVHTLLTSAVLMAFAAAANGRSCAVLRLFEAKTAHHPLIHAVSGDFQLAFSHSLIQMNYSSFFAFSLTKLALLPVRVIRTPRRNNRPSKSDPVQPKHRSNML